MKIGIGIPNHLSGVAGTVVVDWARRAERCGFDALTTIDRLIYPSLDSITTLAVAAGATSTVDLVPNVLLAPLYPPVILAKQVATLADASGGRLTLGVGVGARPDDYRGADVEFDTRGRTLDAAVTVWRRVWAGEPLDGDTALCPAPICIPVLFGGKGAPTLRRVATVGDGWAGGAVRDYETQASFTAEIRARWLAAGRAGHPVMQTSVNFALGDDDVLAQGRRNLAAYYGNKPDYAALNVADMVSSPRDAVETVMAYRDLGFDRLLFHPAVASPDQVYRLADAVL
ncbi:LLM class flavin-dependent oxidoreductase [Mycobacterium sp. NPDC006124]|uniref:LLM class flavin-dependent oxidoreductase n=1 Tax=Mycobacterium sp. NPDC006124 TaxID=3156729 RepID=UPI0033B2E4B6